MKTFSTRVLRVTHPKHATDHLDAPGPTQPASSHSSSFPVLLTVHEAADLLRTSRRAIYAMVGRHQLPGVVRISRRVLFRTTALLDWLDQKRAPSPQE